MYLTQIAVMALVLGVRVHGSSMPVKSYFELIGFRQVSEPAPYCRVDSQPGVRWQPVCIPRISYFHGPSSI